MGFFLPGHKQEQLACKKYLISSRTAGTMCPGPASGTQQAGAFPRLRADADVVAVVSDRSLLPPGGSFSLSLPFPPPALNGFSSGYCWDVAQAGTSPV